MVRRSTQARSWIDDNSPMRDSSIAYPTKNGSVLKNAPGSSDGAASDWSPVRKLSLTRASFPTFECGRPVQAAYLSAKAGHPGSGFRTAAES